jgi:Ser-tRNA(Ala) deacylase AlaX
MNHSIRLYEKNHPLRLTARIVDIAEQPVKIVKDGKPSIVNALGLVLSETIFHPQGGGQPSDQGYINGLHVLTVREDKSQSPAIIYHFLDLASADANIQPGQEVELRVDEAFRKQCQRSHSAGHLIADILELNPRFSHYQAKATHGHHFPGSEYIKVVVPTLPENIDMLSQEINATIVDEINNDLSTNICAQDGMRHIKIGDSSRMCGGTHVNSTKEIEQCQVTKIKSGKNKEGQLELTIFYQC